jgi:phenylalanyl-tRNA synthetase beta subunit
MKARINNKLVEATAEEMVHYYFDGKEWCQKWEKKFDACEIIMMKQAQELETIRKKVLDGQLSPLAYHLQTNLFNLNLLSSYTGISKRRIKKHLNPNHFEQLDEKTLSIYASIFEITVEELKTVSV